PFRGNPLAPTTRSWDPRRSLGLQLLHRLQDLLVVAARARGDVVPGGDVPLAVDDHRPAHDRHVAEELLALVHRLAGAFPDRDAELLGQLALRVGQEGELQVVGLLELAVRLGGVGADAHHLHALGLDLLEVVAEAASLGGAAAGEVRRVEVKHDDLLADVLARLPGLALVIDALERRGLVADLRPLAPLRGRQPAAAYQGQGRQRTGPQTHVAQTPHGRLPLQQREPVRRRTPNRAGPLVHITPRRRNVHRREAGPRTRGSARSGWGKAVRAGQRPRRDVKTSGRGGTSPGTGPGRRGLATPGGWPPPGGGWGRLGGGGGSRWRDRTPSRPSGAGPRNPLTCWRG